MAIEIQHSQQFGCAASAGKYFPPIELVTYLEIEHINPKRINDRLAWSVAGIEALKGV